LFQAQFLLADDETEYSGSMAVSCQAPAAICQIIIGVNFKNLETVCRLPVNYSSSTAAPATL
jgi:hypothetical protein